MNQDQIKNAKMDKNAKADGNNNPQNKQGILHQACPYHLKNYVAYCILHSELVCEECCDLSHHRDHNNQILLLKAAAQNYLIEIDQKQASLAGSRNHIQSCENFNLKNSLRKSIIEFFDSLHKQIDVL